MFDFLQRFKIPALSAQARIIAAIVAVLVVGAASTASYLLLHNSNVPLFAHPLLPDQSAEVESRLIAWNIPYVERDNTIFVEALRHNDIELRLSLEGIPHAHLTSTNETLATVGAMTPQSVLDVQAREGLDADLAVGIRSIQGVRDARVIVAPASQGLFADEPAQTTKASVRVTLDPAMALSAATVTGIKTFVADSVPGLVASNVAVMDDRGVALGSDAHNDWAHDQSALQTSLQAALDATIGAGLTLVRVNVQTEPAAVTRREIKRAALAGAALTDGTIHEQYQSSGKTYAKTHANLERGSDTVDEQTRIDAGGTKRVSVAVFVDTSKAAQIRSITTLVTAAAGLDRRRGDTIEVAAMTFAQPQVVPPLGSQRTVLAQIMPAAPGALITLGIVVAVLMFARPVTAMFEVISRRYAVATTQQQVPAGALTSRELHESLVNEPPHTAAVVLSRLPGALVAEVLERFPGEARRDILMRMSRTHSPIVANIGSSATQAAAPDSAR